MKFLQALKERRPERCMSQVFIGCESHSLLLHEAFNHLPIEQISFELEGVSKLFKGWVVVVITSFLTDFSGKPLEGFSWIVLEVLMNGSYFQAVAEIPPQQGHIQQDLFHRHDSQKLSSSLSCIFPSSFLVLFHVPGIILSRMVSTENKGQNSQNVSLK